MAADFASMIYGTAQNVAQNQGAGLAEGFAKGASLALEQEKVLQSRAQLERQKQELENSKWKQVSDYYSLYDKLPDGPAKKTLGSKVIPASLSVMGLSQEMNPAVQDMLTTDPDLGAFLTSRAAQGQVNQAEIAQAIKDPKKFTELATKLGFATWADEKLLAGTAEKFGTQIGKAEEQALSRASSERAAQARVNAAAGQRTVQNATELRKEVTSHPVSKETFVINSSFDRIKGAFAGTPSAAGDLSGIFAYMKMLDPGSTVREGEFANAQNAAGIPDQARNAYNRALKGERLNPNQRKDFLNQATKIYESQTQKQSAVNKEFESIAKESGVNPKQIFAGTDLKQTPGARFKNAPTEQLKAYLQKFPNGPDAAEIRKILGGK